MTSNNDNLVRLRDRVAPEDFDHARDTLKARGRIVLTTPDSDDPDCKAYYVDDNDVVAIENDCLDLIPNKPLRVEHRVIDDNIPDDSDDLDPVSCLIGAVAALAVAGLAYAGYKGVKALKRRHNSRKQLKLEQKIYEQHTIDSDVRDDISNVEEDTDELQRSEEERTAEEER